MNRRSFLHTLRVAGAALLSTLAAPLRAARPPAVTAATPDAPNILIVLVDQLRDPMWFLDQAALDAALPAQARLRDGAVIFRRHYAAANACSPARATLLTGLYAHQTYCMLTITGARVPVLNTGFPTWGTLLRTLGYQTSWYGKWHVSLNCFPSAYGFSGGTCPPATGLPGQGLARDPGIAQQFVNWFTNKGDSGPWCTTVSFVNPHDISWYPRWSNLVPRESNPPRIFQSLPPNFETPTALEAANKPRLQRVLQSFADQNYGALAFEGDSFEAGWLKMLDLYLLVQQYVDAEIAKVLNALESVPQIADNTVVIFTADHGEYCGSHGLRGKTGAVYEEAIRVPFYVKDYTGRFMTNPQIERAQLTSSVDLLPLLLTMASGSDAWRSQAPYAHLAGRADMATILQNPQAPGRSRIIYSTDEHFLEEVPNTPYPNDVPSHVIGMGTASGKLGVNSFWAPGTIDIQVGEQETEFYDYGTQAGRLELANTAGPANNLYQQLYQQLIDDAIPNELRQPLPDYLLTAQQEARQLYLEFADSSWTTYLPEVIR